MESKFNPTVHSLWIYRVWRTYMKSYTIMRMLMECKFHPTVHSLLAYWLWWTYMKSCTIMRMPMECKFHLTVHSLLPYWVWWTYVKSCTIMHMLMECKFHPTVHSLLAYWVWHTYMKSHTFMSRFMECKLDPDCTFFLNLWGMAHIHMYFHAYGEYKCNHNCTLRRTRGVCESVWVERCASTTQRVWYWYTNNITASGQSTTHIIYHPRVVSTGELFSSQVHKYRRHTCEFNSIFTFCS